MLCNLFAVGDCNFGCVGGPEDWEKGEGMAPVPKISYPGEEQPVHAVRAIRSMDQHWKHGKSDRLFDSRVPLKIRDTWWPWGAGMFATSFELPVLGLQTSYISQKDEDDIVDGSSFVVGF